MTAFDKVIGYAKIKKELMKISDVLKNPAHYECLGASLPNGLLLEGSPGLGKTLMANCLIEESGLPSLLCRKDISGGKFVDVIRQTFEEALEKAPSIVFLDDMDKFSNSDYTYTDTKEYVAIQSCMDRVKGKGVFVIATSNNMNRLPGSLLRAGRFDRTITVCPPKGEEACDIIRFYLSSKKVDPDIDVQMLSRIMEGRSCADLEMVINEAGLCAGYKRKELIDLDDVMEACLRTIFKTDYLKAGREYDDYILPQLKLKNANHCDLLDYIVCHEVGHALVSELLMPGSVTLVSINELYDHCKGFTAYYLGEQGYSYEAEDIQILRALGGMAACEHRLGIRDVGCTGDLRTAYDIICSRFSAGYYGFQYFSSDYLTESQTLRREKEAKAAAEMDSYYWKAKQMIANHEVLFERLAAELRKKKLITAADIQKIKTELALCA